MGTFIRKRRSIISEPPPPGCFSVLQREGRVDSAQYIIPIHTSNSSTYVITNKIFMVS